MADPTIPLAIMAFFFGIHIVLVNIDMGLGILVPILKRVGELRNNQVYIREARKYMRYFAIFYATAGVFGTGFTVFLLTFFPEFLWLGGVVLLVPFALAVLFLTLRFLSLALYWYGWDRFRPDYHFYIGLVLAFTSFAVPFSFRTVFSFLNYPAGVENLEPLEINIGKMFTNPTLWPIYLKSIVGSLAVTFFMLVTLYTYKYYKGIGDKEENIFFIKKYLYIGFWFVFLQFIFGFWYLSALSATAPYKFANIAGAWFGGNVTADYSWLFLIKLLFVAFQAGVILYLFYYAVKNGSINFDDVNVQYMLMGLGPAAALTIVLGEYLNAFSQLPYFVAQPGLESVLPMINVFNSLNDLATFFDLYAITLFAVVPLFLVFLVFLYYVLAGRVSNGEQY